jgi:protoheme IX farnesyltransferase
LRSRVRAGAPDSRAMRLFHGSISYLSLLFLVVAIDPFLA